MNPQDIEPDSNLFDKYGNEVEVIAVDEPFVWIRRLNPNRETDVDQRGFITHAKNLYETERAL